MEVITRDTEEVRAYFEALEEGIRYLDTVTAHFRPAMNGEVYLTGEDVCRLLHITPRTLQDYRTQRLIPYISLPGKDALPPVGFAAYAGGELRGHAPKAQTGEKSNINARGCASGNAAKAGTPHRKFLPLPAFCARGRHQAVSRRERRTRFPSCLLSFFSSTLRCMAARLPEIARKSELTILLVTSA